MKKIFFIVCIFAFSQTAIATSHVTNTTKEKHSPQQLAKAGNTGAKINNKLNEELSLNSNGILN